jgi:hypothetical protein
MLSLPVMKGQRMPTYDTELRFLFDYARLTTNQKVLFATAFKKMVVDPKAGSGFRIGLRIKGVQGHSGVFEMTWAPDGRHSRTASHRMLATFTSSGDESVATIYSRIPEAFFRR